MWKQQQLRCGAEEEEDGKEGGKAAKVVEERAELLWGTEPCAGRAYIEAGAGGVAVECAAVESVETVERGKGNGSCCAVSCRPVHAPYVHS